MRSAGLATIALAAAHAGCAMHWPMPRPLTPQAVAQVQEALESRGAWLEYGYPGQPPLVAAVERGSFRHVDRGRASLILYTDEPDHAVPLERARSLQVNNRWLGALEGLGIGLLSGAVAGALLAPAGASDCEGKDSDHCWGFDFSEEIMLSSLLVGSALGAGIGAAVGQRIVYTF